MTERTLAAVARALEAPAHRPGVFSGYASLFGVVDSQGDLVEKGAFRPSLEAWRAKGRRPAMLWQHDAAEPIGLWTDLVEDEIGLRVEGRLLLSVQRGADAYEHLKAGTISGLSIGYAAVESRRDRKTGLRRLVTVTLWEISLVTFPANTEARVATVKADDDRLGRALRRVAATRPALPFGRKALTPYEASTGRPQPRGDAGQWTRLAGPGAGRARVEMAKAEREARVDWDFFVKEEGTRLDLYAPSIGDKSGITIATGVDLGQRNREEIGKLPIGDALIQKLLPFAGLRGEAAKARAKAESGRFRLEPHEAEALDAAIFADIYTRVKGRYDGEYGGGAFEALPKPVRTVIMSIAYNEGPYAKAPNFRGYVARGDWVGAIRELRNWSTRKDYPSKLLDRRRREADYLERHLRSR
jgi:uncharacterized protein